MAFKHNAYHLAILPGVEWDQTEGASPRFFWVQARLDAPVELNDLNDLNDLINSGYECWLMVGFFMANSELMMINLLVMTVKRTMENGPLKYIVDLPPPKRGWFSMAPCCLVSIHFHIVQHGPNLPCPTPGCPGQDPRRGNGSSPGPTNSAENLALQHQESFFVDFLGFQQWKAWFNMVPYGLINMI